MFHRPLRRAAALSLGALLAFAGAASADSLFADADAVTPVVDGSRHLGDVSPGGLASADVRFLLVCAGLQHVDASQSVVLTQNGGTVPLDGAIVSVSPVTLDPLTTAWAADGLGCPDPVPAQEGGSLSHVVLRAPTTAGTHTFTVAWNRGLEPVGSNDTNAFSRTLTSVNFTVRVVANAAPTLTVPPSFTVEGDTTGGWAADWSGVSATDPEDAPDPAPSCVPAAGAVLPVGTTHVTCSVTDSAGASDSDAFDVTVEDTTAPVLSGVPGDFTVTTSDPAGRVVTYSDPSATDVVDASPSLACDPASGDTFPVATTTVTCVATDATGNSTSATFDVTVDFVAQHAASATWLEPVAHSDTTFVANPGRTLPIKVRLFVDSVERTSGTAGLTLTPCGGGSAMQLALDWGGGRWNHSLDTSMLAGGCYEVAATIEGTAAGSLRLVLRDEAAKTASQPGGSRAR
jgi:HYR domain